MNFLRQYTHWLHTQWPAGLVEKLPMASEDGTTNVSGVYVVGDLRGVPLLKFATDGGARAVRHIVEDRAFQALRKQTGDTDVVDIAIVGGGVAGMAAAIEAKTAGLTLPLSVRLTGNRGKNTVSVNPAVTNARPVSGNKVDGNNVSGSNSTTGTTYTITLTEITDMLHLYPDIPDSVYSVRRVS